MTQKFFKRLIPFAIILSSLFLLQACQEIQHAIDLETRHVPGVEYPTNFNENITPIYKDENGKRLWGYALKNGTLLAEPQFEAATPFQDGYGLVRIKGLWGYLDLHGQVKIKPRYLLADLFFEKLARVQIEVQPGVQRWGYINQEGDYKILPKYDEAQNFMYGKAWVKSGRKWMLIDLEGEVLEEHDPAQASKTP